MNILLLSSNRGQICGINLAKPVHLLLMIGLAGLVMSGAVYLGYMLNPDQDNQAMINEWQADVHRQQVQLKHIREESDADIDALASRIGLLQAHVMRLDALGRKLVHMARIDKAEFDFDSIPALGGPETNTNRVFELDELSKAIDQLSRKLADRENQLVVMENLVLGENLKKKLSLAVVPLLKDGYLPTMACARTRFRGVEKCIKVSILPASSVDRLSPLPKVWLPMRVNATTTAT